MKRKEFIQNVGLAGLAVGLPVEHWPNSDFSEQWPLENDVFVKHPAKVVDRPANSLIRAVVEMPDLPSPYKMKDWAAIAKKQDDLLYDFNAEGHFLPLIKWDNDQTNFPIRSFVLPSYVGDRRDEDDTNSDYEFLPVIGSIIGASLVGIDKSDDHGHDFVAMCKQFFNKKNGADLVSNTTNSQPGHTFWYEIWPGMAFNMLSDLYPDHKDIARIMRRNAQKWMEAVKGLSLGKNYPDFNFTAYSFEKNKGVYNGVWREHDAAAGLAWLEFTTWEEWGDQKFLDASKACMTYLENRPAKQGPYYEIMMPYGAYLAVRMNSELGTDYDELKMLNWCFDGNNTDRDRWGATTGTWGQYDAFGLIGQNKWEQYAFAMNTFSQAAALVPVAKYHAVYAKDIGKWVLNLANASRLFYGDEHPKNQQSSALWQGDPDHAICYEGVRRDLDHDNHFKVFKGILAGRGPYAIADQVKQFSAFTDICLYGSSWVGMLASIVEPTNVKGILALDCNATDFYASSDMPSYLIYNPYGRRLDVQLNTGNCRINVYDRVSQKILRKDCIGNVELPVEGKDAVSMAFVPANLTPEVKGGKLKAGSTVIDHYYDNPSRPKL